MLETLKNWALCACFASVAGAIVYMIAPSGSMQKIFRFSLCVFFLGCLLSPFVLRPEGISFSWEGSLGGEPDRVQQEVEQEMDRYIYEQFKRNLQTIVEKSLQGIEVLPDAVEIDLNTDDPDSIRLERITIHLQEEYRSRQGEITERIRTDIGLAPALAFV